MSLPTGTVERNRPTVEEAVRTSIERWLPGGPAPLLVGASGGRDSMTLLAAAAAVSEALGRRVEALHVDHRVRPDSAENRDLVASEARRLGVPCHVEAIEPDVPATETHLRRARLRAFARASARADHAPVLVAHHLDDAVETVALNLARGHGEPRGLAGVPTSRPLTAHAPLVRPFLVGPRPLGRGDVAEDAARLGVRWRDDPTNADASIPRNAVRAWLAHEDDDVRAALVDVMRRGRRRLERAVTRAADALAEGLAREGLGSRWFGLVPRDRDVLAELLRLYGWTLATPHRVDPRRAVVDDLAAALEAGSGRVVVPARPAPLTLHAGPRGFHAPDAPLADTTTPHALAVAAVARTSCFV